MIFVWLLTTPKRGKCVGLFISVDPIIIAETWIRKFFFREDNRRKWWQLSVETFFGVVSKIRLYLECQKEVLFIEKMSWNVPNVAKVITNVGEKCRTNIVRDINLNFWPEKLRRTPLYEWYQKFKNVEEVKLI